MRNNSKYPREDEFVDLWVQKAAASKHPEILAMGEDGVRSRIKRILEVFKDAGVDGGDHKKSVEYLFQHLDKHCDDPEIKELSDFLEKLIEASWEPSAVDLQWGVQTLELLSNPGVLMTTSAIYMVDKTKKTITVTCRTPWFCPSTHRKNTILFGKLGYTMAPIIDLDKPAPGIDDVE